MAKQALHYRGLIAGKYALIKVLGEDKWGAYRLNSDRFVLGNKHLIVLMHSTKPKQVDACLAGGGVQGKGFKWNDKGMYYESRTHTYTPIYGIVQNSYPNTLYNVAILISLRGKKKT